MPTILVSCPRGGFAVSWVVITFLSYNRWTNNKNARMPFPNTIQ